MHPRRPISIVVSITRSEPSLERCLMGIERTAGPDDSVFLVIDRGTDSGDIEARIASFLQTNPTYRSVLNTPALGYVRSSNLVVLELDQTGNDVLLLDADAELTDGAIEEMLDVLDLSERHGAVCPRSDNAEIATIPWRRHAPSVDDRDRRTRSLAVFTEIAPLLPRFYVSPVVVGFCMLVRRRIIDNYGLFDIAFSGGFNAEKDFCLRINALGYSSVIANHAFVYHAGDAHEKSRTKDEVNSASTLRSRHPYYSAALAEFTEHRYAAVDQFADLLVTPGTRKRVLIDLHHLAVVMNGSTRNALSFLEYLATLELGEVEITVAAPPGAIPFFDLPVFGFRVVPWGSSDELYDLGVAIAPVTTVAQLEQLNLHCARWLVIHLDVIAIRSIRLASTDPQRADCVRDALKYADRVITISESTMADTSLLLGGREDFFDATKWLTVPQGSTRGSIRDSAFASKINPGDSGTSGGIAPGFVLVVGNYLPHKQVRRAIESLVDLDVTIVALGADAWSAEDGRSTVTSLNSGLLSEQEMGALYRDAAVVVFPSSYEGFGLPIADALDWGTPVVAFETAVVREVIAQLDADDAIVMFERFADLASTVERVMSDATLTSAAQRHRNAVRHINEFNAAIWSEAIKLLGQPLDVGQLVRRYDDVVLTTGYSRAAVSARESSAELQGLRAELESITSSRSFRFGHWFAKAAKPMLNSVRRLRR